MFLKQSGNPNSAAIYTSNILVVDDTALNRELIGSYLESEGYHNVLLAYDGKDALEKMEKFTPALIITDLMMPVMDGIELIRHVRRSDQFRKVPIIVQTALTNDEEKQEAWLTGANDVLSKPIHKLELLSRVKVQLVTTHVMMQLDTYYQSSQQDIKQALTLQRSLIPSAETLDSIQKRYGIQINYIFEPSRFLSGDLWGLLEIDDHQLGIWICDYSGKGIKAALNTFRIHTLVQEYKNSAATPSEMIDLLNRRFHSMIDVGQFATFLMGVLDVKKKTFRYVAASAPHPLIYNAEKKEFTVGDGTGLPLGVSDEAQYPLRTTEISIGHSLVLYSDMLWEEKALPGISLLPEHLQAFAEDLKGKPLVPTVREQLTLIGDISLVDDLTLVEITL